MDYFALGKIDAANFELNADDKTTAQQLRRDAYQAATGKGTMSVTITVKDEQGKPVVRSMRGDRFIVYLSAWPPFL